VVHSAAVAVPGLFEFVDVSVEGADGLVLEGVTARIDGGGITAVVGPSGAGKSTLLRLCNRLDAPSKGTVRYRGSDVAALDPTDLRRRVGMLGQRPIPFPGTVRDNLQAAAPGADDDTLAACLDRVYLSAGLLGRTADDLSVGEQQRMCLARALLTEPETLLMDEPTSALDSEARSALERLGRELVDEDVSMLWVSHDLEQARRMAAQALVIVLGRVWGPAPLDALADAPAEFRDFWKAGS
jgi:putative ABC transport system ATP-binding protein